MKQDFLNELGELALGSRLKRLSESMIADATKVYQNFDIEVQPKWFTLLALLHKNGATSVVEASERLGLSQPAISQFCRQLEKQQLIKLVSSKQDMRKKHMHLTAKGKQQVEKMQPMWLAVDAAAKELCREFNDNFYSELLKFEQALNQQSLLSRTMNKLHTNVDILEFTPELAPYFDIINRQWLCNMFKVENVDEQVLSNPQKHIINQGGNIWFAKHPLLGIVGTCALVKHEQDYYELTKMGVLENARGLKAGEKLLEYVLNECKQFNLPHLFLLTNKKCEAAIHLYEKVGFTHSKDIMQRFAAKYQRCDVAMYFDQTNRLV